MNGYDDHNSYEEAPVADSTHRPTRSASGKLLNGGQVTVLSGDEPPHTQKTTKWQIHWKAPTLILGLLFVGIALALGHHFYYMSLNGTVVSSDTRQEWALRFGTAFAFLTQSSLVASAGVSYTQRLWVTVKKRAFPLRTLDNIFSLQSTLFAFLSWDILAKAKVLYILGICIWCIPLSSLITPATLSVRTGVNTAIQTVNVPYPDYSINNSVNWANFEGAGNLQGPTPEVTRIAGASLTSMAVLPFTAPSPNSSYSLQFYGPTFQCQNMSDAVVNNTLDTGTAATLQEAWDSTMNDKFPSYDFGMLYIGATPMNSTDFFTVNHLFVNTNGVGAQGRNYSCHMWNASYTVSFDSQDGVQSAEIQKVEPVAPLDIHAVYFDNYSPGEMQFWTMTTALTNALTAVIRWGSTGSLLGTDTDIVTSALAACPEMKEGTSLAGANDLWLDSSLCRAGSIPGAIEDLSRNLTLSVLGSASLATQTAAQVTVQHPATFYSYNWRNLVLAYAVVVCVTAACAAVGLHALVANGYSAESTFSSILLTTRNADLDDLARGQCLGDRPLAKNVGDTRLRYGILRSQALDGTAEGSHACFGFADDVRELKRGEPCW